MTEDHVDRLVASARANLHQHLEATPPDFGRLARSRKRRRIGVGAAVLLTLAALAVPQVRDSGDHESNLIAGPSDEPSTEPPTEAGANADLLPPGETRPLAPSPLAGRSTSAAVWTGEEMIIWGGDGANEQYDDGASYNPRSDKWTVLADAPLNPRSGPAAVWTGTEAIVWGGSSSDENYQDGAAYNPATGSWRTISESPLSSAGRPLAFWTGSEMIVLAGFNSADAAAYNPVLDTWRTLPDLPGQLQPPSPVGVWTGDEVVAVVHTDTSGSAAPQIVALEPDNNAWITEGSLPAGNAVLAWTGDSLTAAANQEAFAVSNGSTSTIADAPSGIRIDDAPSVWTGRQLIQWSGDSASAIDPTAASWQRIPSGVNDHRIQPALVWADGILIAWGGFPDLADGVMLRPPT